MKSLLELYKIGMGPSSSHTMGPKKAGEDFLIELGTVAAEIANFEVDLFGSLALTGAGHLTDRAVLLGLNDPKAAKTKINWRGETYLDYHPNALTIRAFDQKKKLLGEKTYYSVGGGAIISDDELQQKKSGCSGSEIYPEKNLAEIKAFCQKNKLTLWEYVELREGPEILPALTEIWQEMKASMNRGLKNTADVLPGKLKYPRKARYFYQKAMSAPRYVRRVNKLFAYALAVAEENGAGGQIVTAPTCGSCGILPAVLKHFQDIYEFDDEDIARAVATAGIFGNLAKANASISGAEAGCQAEVGVACAMAAAASCQLEGGNLEQIEYAAEMGLEHHLGLTCDPVMGYVQIPCIERNAMAATRAVDCATYAIMGEPGQNHIDYDQVLEVMMETGRDLKEEYRETALGGLALAYQRYKGKKRRAAGKPRQLK